MRIQLFGEMDIRADGEGVHLDSGRARSLLAYLLVHDGRSHLRQRLAFLLWPDSTEAQARTNLRHLLHTLRAGAPAIDRFLEVTPTTLRWRRETACWIDVAEFDAAIARAEHGDASHDEVLAALREAIELYSGDLLEGHYDDWLQAERERLCDRYAGALQRLAGLLVEGGDHAEAIRCGRELLRCDPLREDAYRLLMSLLRVYHECASVLLRELGVDPSPATTAEYSALMRQAGAGPLDPQEEPRVKPAVLVGRDEEWARLTARWRDAEHGRAQLVLVTGEPGIGKTRLVDEFAGWCTHRGALVAQGRSYPGGGELAFGMTSSWLRKPSGPGWALVGDAGYIRDPITAQGITDAFRDAELCATAIDEAFGAGRSFDDAMTAYQQTRDAQVLPIYLRVHHSAGHAGTAASGDAATARGRCTATRRPWTASPASPPAPYRLPSTLHRRTSVGSCAPPEGASRSPRETGGGPSGRATGGGGGGPPADPCRRPTACV